MVTLEPCRGAETYINGKQVMEPQVLRSGIAGGPPCPGKGAAESISSWGLERRRLQPQSPPLTFAPRVAWLSKLLQWLGDSPSKGPWCPPHCLGVLSVGSQPKGERGGALLDVSVALGARANPPASSTVPVSAAVIEASPSRADIPPLALLPDQATGW